MGRVFRRALAAAVFTVAQVAFGQEPSRPVFPGAGELIATQDPPKVVPRVLDRATPANTRVVVSLGRQRAYLYVDEEVAIDSPVSTGRRRGQTPTGNFTVLEKATEQSSNLHWDFVDGNGNAVRHGVSTRIDAAPSGTTFRPVPVPYFLRLDDTGLALHAGRLPGYPSADRAVRLPVDIAPLVFQRVKQGTPVKIEE